jgi:heptosyltransferase-2
MSSERPAGEGSPRILVALWPGIGDIVFATPAIRHLRREFPDAYIAALSLDGGPGRELLDTNPYLDETYFTGKGGIYSASNIREAARWARSRRFEAGLELAFPMRWFFRLAGIREAHGFAERPLWLFIPYRDKEEGRNTHASEHFLKAVDRLAGRQVARDGRGYDVFLTDADRERAEELLREAERQAGGRRRVVIHPGARCNRNKRWGAEKFAELGRRLAEERGAFILVVGGPEDAELGDGIASALPGRALNLAGRTTLRETAALVERCHLFVGNDSGPLHVAASTPTPPVAVFASSNPGNFAPLHPRARVVQPEEPCVPCLHFPGYMWLPWGFRLRYYDRCRAMEGLGVEPVLEACLEVLG